VAEYCSLEDLTTLGIFADALRSVDPQVQEEAIRAASDEMDGYLGSRYKLPLTAWGRDVRIMCVRLSVYTIVASRGFNPNSSGDAQILEMHDLAERWMKRVSDGSLALTVTDSANLEPGHVSGGVQVFSNGGRGYQGSSTSGAFTGRGR
jgi:phage gp36-like protein